jgi:hypothetical protein
MQDIATLWSILNSAMRPLAEEVYRDLRDSERGAPAGLSQEHATVIKGELAEALKLPIGDEPPPTPVAVAALSFDGLFGDARRRAAWYFRLHLLLAIGMVSLFLGGAGGALVSAVGWGINIWAIVFGGLSVTSAFGLFIDRPFQMVYSALVSVQRIDYLQLRYKQLLADCAALPDLQARMDCRANAWNTMRNDLLDLK